MFLKSSGEAYKLSMSSKPIEKKVLEEEEEEEEERVANLGISINGGFTSCP
jgi:CTP synthase (UTP-ammonia lyase)